MFRNFREHFVRDHGCEGKPVTQLGPDTPEELRELFREFAGLSFCGGMYRIVHPADWPLWAERLAPGFGDLDARLTSFGYDWLGRLFALDRSRIDRGMQLVLMLEPGTGEALEIPATLISFHNDELIKSRDAAIAASAFEEWRSEGHPSPRMDECIGYRRPLFLGGADDFSNMELSNIDVYWHLMGELAAASRDLLPGTPINKIRME